MCGRMRDFPLRAMKETFVRSGLLVKNIILTRKVAHQDISICSCLMLALRPRLKLPAPSDILRALAQVRASQDRRSSAISLYRRATTTTSPASAPAPAPAAATPGDSSHQSDASQGRHSKKRGDPLSLCGLAQLLLAPYRRHRARPPASPLPYAGREGGDGERSTADGAGVGGVGGGAVTSRPETEATASPTAPLAGGGAAVTKEALPWTHPTEEEKDEAARLLARAFAAAGGVMPPEEEYYFGRRGGSEAHFAGGGGSGGDGDGEAGAGGGRREEGRRDNMVLAEVHLVMSGFTLKEGRGGGGGGGPHGAKEWHLREAARVSSPDTKAGIIARCGRLWGLFRSSEGCVVLCWNMEFPSRSHHATTTRI